MPLQDSWGEPTGAIAVPEFDEAVDGMRVDIKVTQESGDNTNYRIKTWEATSSTKFSASWQPAPGTDPDATDNFVGKDGLNKKHPIKSLLVNNNYYAFRMIIQKKNALGAWVDDSTQPALSLYQYSTDPTMPGGGTFSPVQPTEYAGN